MERPKQIIGRRNGIDIPGFGYMDLKAKVDTGAYGCAIQCSKIEVILQEGKEVQIITGADILGRLLRGIASNDQD